MDELTDAQLARQDYVNGLIYETILASHPCADGLDWNIEMIGEVREKIRIWLVERLGLVDEMRFYPYLEE